MGAVRVTVDTKGNPWVVTEQTHIYRYVDLKWMPYPEGVATDLEIGPEGSFFITYRSRGTWKWLQDGWVQVGRRGSSVGVDATGKPYIVIEDGSIYWPEKTCAD
jgi:hypothetical protein